MSIHDDESAVTLRQDETCPKCGGSVWHHESPSGNRYQACDRCQPWARSTWDPLPLDAPPVSRLLASKLWRTAAMQTRALDGFWLLRGVLTVPPGETPTQVLESARQELNRSGLIRYDRDDVRLVLHTD